MTDICARCGVKEHSEETLVIADQSGARGPGGAGSGGWSPARTLLSGESEAERGSGQMMTQAFELKSSKLFHGLI